MLEKLAGSLGRNDEEPNIELARQLCESGSKEDIKEIADGMNGSDRVVANDCIKVLYEIGYKRPELIADYAGDFISHLRSKNNRLAWGSMIALAVAAELRPGIVYEKIDVIKKAYEEGSVITVDNSITVFAKLCKAAKEYEKEIFPLILRHLSSCRPKEVPQHAERASICINGDNLNAFLEVMEQRRCSMNEAQNKRINKLIKELKAKLAV